MILPSEIALPVIWLACGSGLVVQGLWPVDRPLNVWRRVSSSCTARTAPATDWHKASAGSIVPLHSPAAAHAIRLIRRSGGGRVHADAAGGGARRGRSPASAPAWEHPLPRERKG